ncbi:MAG: alpha/beta hydrolase [Thermomicrobiales bacterium]
MVQTSSLNSRDPHADQPVLASGAALENAPGALILIHGRGASAHDILPLAGEIGAEALACLAPQAAGNTWYPLSFLMPMQQNEPFLSSALAKVETLVTHVETAGISAEHIIVGGFSQGACLASEFIARHARRYGGLLVFSGGLIGPEGTPRDYQGSLNGTPVFIGCSNVDAHIPEARVLETGEVLQRLGADVDLRIYPGMGHTINRDELEAARPIVSRVSAKTDG